MSSNYLRTLTEKEVSSAHIAEVLTKLNPGNIKNFFKISSIECSKALMENSLMEMDSYGHWKHAL